MFHAVIHRDRDRLRVSGSVEPYDVQLLREHLLAYKGKGTRVEVRIPPRLRAAFLTALGDVERRGVTVVIS